MSTLKVEICKIEKVEKHPYADKLDLVQVKGWICIVQKDSFTSEDLCLYIPIDSILPQEVEEKIFGVNSKIKLENHRIKTIKLRKIISQGLVVKPEVVGITKYNEGDDFTKELKIIKYEPPTKQPSIYGECNRIKKKYINSNFHKYTDIENIKNHPKVFQEGELVYISCKLHGTSCRLGWVKNEANSLWKKIKKLFGFFNEYEFLIGSRNIQFNSSNNKKKIYYDENIYERVAKQYNLQEKLLPGEILYGEIVGYGIQSGYNYGCKNGEIKFYAYDFMENDKWLDPTDFRILCTERQIPKVPILYAGPFDQEIVKRYTQGPSDLCPESQPIKEGCVIKADPEQISPYIGRKVLKSINVDYLLLKENSDWH